MRFRVQFFMLFLALVTRLPAQTYTLTDHDPGLDRWVYDNNTTPGFRTAASTFAAAVDPPGDSRFAQILLGYDTSQEIPASQGPQSYSIQSASVVAIASLDEQFADPYSFDPTTDPFTSYLDPSDPDYTADMDAGRPVELFGADLRDDYTEFGFGATNQGDTIFQERDSMGSSLIGERSVFASDGIQDVSNNVGDRFEAVPWSVGQAQGIAPGSPVNLDTEVEFQLDLTNPQVVSYLQTGLDEGGLFFALTSMHDAAQQSANGIAQFWMREGAGLGGVPARLNLTVTVSDSLVGDFNSDGQLTCVDVDSLVVEVVNSSTDLQFDLNGDMTVDAADVEAWLTVAGAENQTSEAPFLAGDANLDGAVDGADFQQWSSHKFTTAPAYCDGDFNADGQIDAHDFLTWNANRSASAGATAVPEPSISWWVLWAMFASRISATSGSKLKRAGVLEWRTGE